MRLILRVSQLIVKSVSIDGSCFLMLLKEVDIHELVYVAFYIVDAQGPPTYSWDPWIHTCSAARLLNFKVVVFSFRVDTWRQLLFTKWWCNVWHILKLLFGVFFWNKDFILAQHRKAFFPTAVLIRTCDIRSRLDSDRIYRLRCWHQFFYWMSATVLEHLAGSIDLGAWVQIFTRFSLEVSSLRRSNIMWLL